MKKRISNKKRAIVSAVSALALCAACVAPAYYGTDIFCGITASAEESAASSTWSVNSGERGTWEFDSNTLTLTINLNAEGKLTQDDVHTILSEANISGDFSVVLGENVQTIGEDAFRDCSSLTSVTMPSVTSIGNWAFVFCSSLTSVTMPSVTSIGWDAFEGCSNLTSVTMPNVTSIGTGSFFDCYNLTSVTMPNVTSIGDCAFLFCSSLTSVTMPSVTSIGDSAFDGCSRLTSVTMPSVTSISMCAFYGCSSLTSVTMPSVTSIGDYAFFYCSNLTSVTIGDVPGYINDYAFDGCENIAFTVPVEYYDKWQMDLFGNNTTTTGLAYGATINLKKAEPDASGFMEKFTIKHEIELEDGYTLPDYIKDKKFTYTITKMNDSNPDLEFDGEFTDGISVINIPKDNFKGAVGEYWYEVKESTNDIANYVSDADTYYLHVITSNIDTTGESDNIGVTQVQLHSKYQQNIELVNGTEVTFALPDGYKNAYTKSSEGNLSTSIEWEESDDNNYQVGYYYKSDDDMDFDVYAWSKADTANEAETAREAAYDEFYTEYLEADEEPMGYSAYLDANKTAFDEKVKDYKDAPEGLNIVYYDDKENFEGVEYNTRTYIINDGTDKFAEFVFWLDEDDDDAEETMTGIIESLALRPSDKTDTMTGTLTPGGSLEIKVNESGTATSSEDRFTVNVEFTVDGDDIPNTIEYVIVDKDNNEGTPVSIAKEEWENKKAIVEITDVPAKSTIKFTNLPDGIEYKVYETFDGDTKFQNPSFAFFNGADFIENAGNITYLDNTSYGNDLADCFAYGTISDDLDTIIITNVANTPMDVGVLLENKPFMAIFGTASAIAACAFVYRKKRISEDTVL